MSGDATALSTREELFRRQPLTYAAVKLIRQIIGSERGERAIEALCLSPLRTFYYRALERTAISYMGRNVSEIKPVTYFEFGVGWGETVTNYIIAAKDFAKDKHLSISDFNITLFDSFKGLPPKNGAYDDHPSWKPGMFAHGVSEVKRVIRNLGLDPNSDRLKIIEGLYEETLTNKLSESLEVTPPQVVTVDCDYYSSTKVVLEWLRPIIKDGCVLYFDDIWVFNGNPHKGQLRAINEFNDKNDGRLSVFPITPSVGSKCFLFSR